MNRNDVIDVLTAVAAATRRTVGQADVEIWQGVIGELHRDECLKAVQQHLRDQPGVWLEPGHVYGIVKEKHRDQLARESNEMREARQAALDARFAGIDELAESKHLPIEPKYQRPPRGPSPLDVRCPWCHANIGSRCVVPGTNEQPEGGIHPSRREAAA